MDTLVWLNLISPGYFNTMATRLVMGRDFAKTDDVKTSRVMIIGESTARHFFGTSNPVGKTISMDTRGDKKVHYEIVGVVEDTKYNKSMRRSVLRRFFPSIKIRSRIPPSILKSAAPCR